MNLSIFFLHFAPRFAIHNDFIQSPIMYWQTYFLLMFSLRAFGIRQCLRLWMYGRCPMSWNQFRLVGCCYLLAVSGNIVHIRKSTLRKGTICICIHRAEKWEEWNIRVFKCSLSSIVCRRLLRVNTKLFIKDVKKKSTETYTIQLRLQANILFQPVWM